MSGAQIVYQRTSGYGKHGQDVQSDAAFMQFFVAFMKDGALRALKGAPLSAFVAVGLHEAEILLGNADPFTLDDIMAVTGYSRPVMVAALDYLVDARFIEELPKRGKNREKQYRVAAYMWFGSGRPKVRKHHSRQSGANAPQSRSKENELLNESKENVNSSLLVVEVSSSKVVEEETTSTAEVRVQVRKIFSTVGMYGDDLERVSAVVTLDHAERIARWINWAKENNTRYDSPPGIALWHLLKDRHWEPSEPPRLWDEPLYAWDYDPSLVEQGEVEAAPLAVGQDGPDSEQMQPAGDDQHASEIETEAPVPNSTYRAPLSEGSAEAHSIWLAALKELELTMTKAAFDTWLRPTFALGFAADGALVVGAHSSYAKEWMENRLQTTIERTVAGVMGKSISVRYQVGGKRPSRS